MCTTNFAPISSKSWIDKLCSLFLQIKKSCDVRTCFVYINFNRMHECLETNLNYCSPWKSTIIKSVWVTVISFTSQNSNDLFNRRFAFFVQIRPHMFHTTTGKHDYEAFPFLLQLPLRKPSYYPQWKRNVEENVRALIRLDEWHGMFCSAGFWCMQSIALICGNQLTR